MRSPGLFLLLASLYHFSFLSTCTAAPSLSAVEPPSIDIFRSLVLVPHKMFRMNIILISHSSFISSSLIQFFALTITSNSFTFPHGYKATQTEFYPWMLLYSLHLFVVTFTLLFTIPFWALYMTCIWLFRSIWMWNLEDQQAFYFLYNINLSYFDVTGKGQFWAS